ncbi:MAG: FtsX-like permease family protein [Kiritimatiellia bacterium]
MKARHICAVAGVAIAVATVVFMRSLTLSNARQGEAFAERLLREMPVADTARVTMLLPDYRPNGIPLQGRPMMALVATREGDDIPEDGIIVSRALFAQRRLAPPAVGTAIPFTGRQGTYVLKVAGVIDWAKPVRGYPNGYVSPQTAARIAEAWRGWTPKTAAELAPALATDEGRNLGYAKPLLIWAAVLTALCLLLNSLFLSIESRRRELAVLRVLGMTRLGVVRVCAGEALALALAGTFLGVAVAVPGVLAYVASDKALFPMGAALAWPTMAAAFAAAPALALVAVLVALRRALAVRPLEAASNRVPNRRPLGTFLSFAFGFGAFVAVEVWGGSLMSAFVPSPEWPDAIVSILPAGVSSFDIEKLQGKIPGVRRIHELQPLQVDFAPREELRMRDPVEESRGPRQAACRNALLLASDWLPDFRFVAGDHDAAAKALAEGDNCVITEMMARARRLELGSDVTLDCGGGLTNVLKVVGIVDLNWHMVTSRGLVRGLNRKPVNTDGPLFVSFDTLAACDIRPAQMVGMTHLWLDYEPAFLAAHGVYGAGRQVEEAIIAALAGADRVMESGEVRGNNVQLHQRDEVADGTLAHGVDIIGSMARIPFVFLAVISLGLVAMLVARVAARRQEFVVLRTVGMTRGRMARQLAQEAVSVALKGMVAGFVFGAAAGWLFTSVTRASMANWGLPATFAVPWRAILQGALGALGFVLAVAVPTSLALIHRKFDRRRRPKSGLETLCI